MKYKVNYLIASHVVILGMLLFFIVRDQLWQNSIESLNKTVERNELRIKDLVNNVNDNDEEIIDYIFHLPTYKEVCETAIYWKFKDMYSHKDTFVDVHLYSKLVYPLKSNLEMNKLYVRCNIYKKDKVYWPENGIAYTEALDIYNKLRKYGNK